MIRHFVRSLGVPAEQAVAIYQKMEHLARNAKAPGDERTADERRADVFADLLLAPAADTDTTTGSEDVRAQVQITIPATTLLGIDKQPDELAGYGAIPARAARELASGPHAVWRRLLTDPVTGVLLDYARTTYRPPAALADHVRARDQRCRFPGCQHPARTADLDHTVPYPHGPTAEHNMGVLCRRHHRMKTHSRWRLSQREGVFTWTSPTGRRYTRTPEPLTDPAPVAVSTQPSPDPDDDPPPF